MRGRVRVAVGPEPFRGRGATLELRVVDRRRDADASVRPRPAGVRGERRRGSVRARASTKIAAVTSQRRRRDAKVSDMRCLGRAGAGVVVGRIRGGPRGDFPRRFSVRDRDVGRGVRPRPEPLDVQRARAGDPPCRVVRMHRRPRLRWRLRMGGRVPVLPLCPRPPRAVARPQARVVGEVQPPRLPPAPLARRLPGEGPPQAPPPQPLQAPRGAGRWLAVPRKRVPRTYGRGGFTSGCWQAG